MKSCKNCSWNNESNECELGFDGICASHDYCEGIIDTNIIFYDNKYFVINESSEGIKNFMYIYRTHENGVIDYHLVGCGNEDSIKIEIYDDDKLYDLFKKINGILGIDNKVRILTDETKCTITFSGKKLNEMNAISVNLGNYRNCKKYFEVDEIYAYLDEEFLFNREPIETKKLLKQIKR